MNHASTLIARSPAQLHAYLSRLPAVHRSQTLFFALSANAPDLGDLVSSLTSFASASVGCLSAPIPEQDHQSHYSCSFAFFDTKSAVPFRSTIAGRPPAQVGRWHAFRKGSETDLSEHSVEAQIHNGYGWEDVWHRRAGERELPKELQGLE
jgi:hypothetical protein